MPRLPSTPKWDLVRIGSTSPLPQIPQVIIGRRLSLKSLEPRAWSHRPQHVMQRASEHVDGPQLLVPVVFVHHHVVSCLLDALRYRYVLGHQEYVTWYEKTRLNWLHLNFGTLYQQQIHAIHFKNIHLKKIEEKRHPLMFFFKSSYRSRFLAHPFYKSDTQCLNKSIHFATIYHIIYSYIYVVKI